jgi:hypothetical protein
MEVVAEAAAGRVDPRWREELGDAVRGQRDRPLAALDQAVMVTAEKDAVRGTRVTAP